MACQQKRLSKVRWLHGPPHVYNTAPKYSAKSNSRHAVLDTLTPPPLQVLSPRKGLMAQQQQQQQHGAATPRSVFTLATADLSSDSEGDQDDDEGDSGECT
jgi:hypothetical protein